MTGPIRVLVVDDQQLLRRGLTMLLDTVDDVDVVGQAGDGREALDLVASIESDVLLTDVRMPTMDGMELLAACREQYPDLPVVLLTTFDDQDVVRAAIHGGAAGFLLKDSSVDSVAEAIRQAVAGGMMIDPRVARSAFTVPADKPGPLASLTPTELQVAELVATGASNAEIAEELFLAEGTVKNHVSTLLRKLDQRDRTRLALFLSRELMPEKG